MVRPCTLPKKTLSHTRLVLADASSRPASSHAGIPSTLRHAPSTSLLQPGRDKDAEALQVTAALEFIHELGFSFSDEAPDIIANFIETQILLPDQQLLDPDIPIV